MKGYAKKENKKIDKFAGRSGAKPTGVLDLQYWSRGCLLDPPPTPPSGHLGPRMCTVKTRTGALGGPFFDHFFTSILSSILDSFWIRFGLVLGSSWPPFGRPNRVKLGPKCVFKLSLFENVDFLRKCSFAQARTTFLTQDGP